MNFLKLDDVLWDRHLAQVPALLGWLRRATETVPITLLVNGEPIGFVRMRGGAPGYRAEGSGKHCWNREIPKGTEVRIEFPEGASERLPSDEIGPPTQRPTVRVGGASQPALRGESPRHAASHRVLRLPQARQPAFDAYVMVDWSASSKPKTGPDSIWWVAQEWVDGALVSQGARNPSTRALAEHELRSYLRAAVAAGKSVLGGFDFPYGYPGGFARALGLRGAPWRATWERVSSLIRDEQARGENNRFLVAGQLNQNLGRSGPFWGHPAGRVVPGLTPTKPPPHPLLPEFRVTERATRGPKSAWQLSGAGSVGGQVLLGLPTLLRLIGDEALAPVSQVWPFETGPLLPERKQGEARIVHAEIYPSLLPVHPAPGQVKDEAQVIGLARWFAEKDASEELPDYFGAPWRRSSSERSRILEEEGWILGV